MPQQAFSIQLPSDQEVGVFADFAMVWRTPNTFVIDFVATKQPPHPGKTPDGQQIDAIVEARVAARVRIPPEQVFRLAQALQEQGAMWLAENGQSEPPESWVGSQPPPTT